jgi:hypothetical protein
MRGILVFVGAAMLLAATPARLLGQNHPETIRGRVISDSGVAVPGAIVSATMADRTFQRVTTDARGEFSIHFEHGTGDYLIHVGAEAFKPLRKRVTRAAGDTLLVGDLKLAPVVATLSAVRVQARKQVPRRGSDPGRDVGAAAEQLEGVFAAVTPDQEGDLTALANAIPGTLAQPDGLSVLGLPGAQSNTALNRLAFNGTSLPRDVQTRVKVITSTYDPAQGGFSGAQTSVELDRGLNYALRRAHVTADAALSSPLGEQIAGPSRYLPALQASIGGRGALVTDKLFYNGGIQLSQRSVDGIDLLTAGDDRLVLAGNSCAKRLRLSDSKIAKRWTPSSASSSTYRGCLGQPSANSSCCVANRESIQDRLIAEPVWRLMIRRHNLLRKCIDSDRLRCFWRSGRTPTVRAPTA